MDLVDLNGMAPTAGVTSELANMYEEGNSGDISLEETQDVPNGLGFEYESYGDEGNYYGYINNGLGITNGILENSLVEGCQKAVRPNNIGVGTWSRIVSEDIQSITSTTSKISKGLEWAGYAGDIVGLGFEVYGDVTENINSGAKWEEYVADIGVDVGFVVGGMLIGAAAGSVVPGAGTLAGAIIGAVVGILYYTVTEVITINGKSLKDWAKTGLNWVLEELFEADNCVSTA